MNEIEVFAVVLQMAAHAVFPVWIAHLNLKVIAVLCGQAACDFFMAIQALKGRRAGSKLMATAALRCSRQRLMGLCERTWRDLGTSAEEREYNEKQRQKKPREVAADAILENGPEMRQGALRLVLESSGWGFRAQEIP